MESSHLVSWQFEDFSTAELSPPSSPISPSSPTLFYDGSNPSSPSGSFKGLNNGPTMAPQSQKPVLSTVATSRAQTASNMLNELERLHYFEHQNDFGMNVNEESVDLNMNLFEELEDIEYTPPLLSSPEESTTRAFEAPISQLSPAPPPASSSAPYLINITRSEDNFKLSAEFKSIVESLHSNTSTTSRVTPQFGNLIQIAGIPTTTVVGDECLVPVEFIGRNGSIGAEETESMELDGIIISNEMEIINESELFSLEELNAELVAEETSTNLNNATLVSGVLPHWAKDMTIPLDALDTEMNKNANTLDALLNGDVSTAKNVISSGYSVEPFSPVSNVSLSEDEYEEESLLESVVELNETTPQPKAERRGRKSKSFKDPLNYIKDKALRKKEQNKTAATRYRLKKKHELGVTLVEEDELQIVHDDLEKEKEKVGAELRMVKSLLREMLQVKKQRTKPSPAVTAGRLTASSIVQAQKVANRRK